MADYDIIISGGTIVDGTRTPRFVSDIAIKDGKIAQIGGLKGKTAERVLDATGRIVAPGFVDLHTHYDAQIFWDPYCTLSGWHGVTSVALGNCGFGFAPSRAEDRDRAMLSMTRNEAIPYEAMKAGMPWDWVTFPDFIESLIRTPKGVNLLTYVPLTPLYAWVMGWESAKTRRPTEAELQEMCRLIHEAMDAGACGWSAQVLGAKSIQRDYDGTPMITDLLSEHEVLTFAKILIVTRVLLNWPTRRPVKKAGLWRRRQNNSLRKSPGWQNGRFCIRRLRRTQCILKCIANGSSGSKAARRVGCRSTARVPRGAVGSK
jgi:N-acyl-D-aspartate/D-glutamate deacylase